MIRKEQVDFYRIGEQGRKYFFMGLALRDQSLEANIQNIIVVTEVWMSRGHDGNDVYGIEKTAEADPMNLYEAQAAIQWVKKLRSGNFTLEKIMSWLSELETHTTNRYLPNSDAPHLNKSDQLIASLASASVHFLIANLRQPNVPEHFKKWFETSASYYLGHQFRWYGSLIAAGNLRQATELGLISTELLEHLQFGS